MAFKMPVAAERTSRRGRVLKKLVIGLGSIPLIAVLASWGLHQALMSVGGTTHELTEINIAGRRVALWKPAGAAPPEGYPVILFSHGLLGCGTQSLALTEGLAQGGYLVLSPDHRDAACGARERRRHFETPSALWSQEPFFDPTAWSETTYRDRAADLEAILDTVTKAGTFQGVPINPDRIGLAGHSLGGYTVLGLAGAWPSWKDSRVKAVLAVSPYCTPYIRKGDLSHLDVPVMYQGGTLDFGVTPYVRRRGGAYDLTSAPKFYVEFHGASHFAWTNLSKSYQPTILAYALAFFDRYLKGEADPLARLYDRPWPEGVSEIRYERE